jgi:hypothetical protein
VLQSFAANAQFPSTEPIETDICATFWKISHVLGGSAARLSGRWGFSPLRFHNVNMTDSVGVDVGAVAAARIGSSRIGASLIEAWGRNQIELHEVA